MRSRLRLRSVYALAAVLALGATASAAPAPALTISAKIDHATVNIGEQVVLTLTLEGDLAGASLAPFELPKALPVVAQQRASNVSIGAAGMVRSLNLTYVLLPQEAGTFHLGPFQAVRQGQSVTTEAIELVVKKPVVPPLDLGPRYTL